MPFTQIEDAEPVSLSPALVVEDDSGMQERLRYVLSTLGCDDPQIAAADSAAAAQGLFEENTFGLVLIDVGLPDDSGVALIGWLQAHHPGVPAVAISASRTEEAIFAALRAGAIGYLLKERDDLELSIAMRSIEQGGASIDPSIARRILSWVAAADDAGAPAAPAEALTARESEILELVAQGLSHRDIAETLSISRLTVERHARQIYRKLAAHSRTEAASPAHRGGLPH